MDIDEYARQAEEGSLLAKKRHTLCVTPKYCGQVFVALITCLYDRQFFRFFFSSIADVITGLVIIFGKVLITLLSPLLFLPLTISLVRKNRESLREYIRRESKRRGAYQSSISQSPASSSDTGNNPSN